MKRIVALCVATLLFCIGASAQRKMDNLGRGLVVVPTGSSTNFVSWRRLGTEYYDVTYNLYKDGTQIASNLTKTSYNDTNNGLTSSEYQVAAVVKGTEQLRSTVVTAWNQYISNSNAAGYIDLPLAKVYDRIGNDVSSHYEPNDAEFADLDGDGELEMIIKRLNMVDAANVYPQSNTTEFVMLDAYDINWQTGATTLMWRIDCGPNMVSLNSTEINIIAFDWDEDGKAEVVLRGADNMIVYGNTGKNQLYTIGNMNVNTRNTFDPANGAQYAWTHSEAEYLIYMNGETGALNQQMEFPLKRLEDGETNLNAAWGDDYGHRSSKYFFGVPYLDGKQPTLFMARGIYTRHKMMVMYLDYKHEWTSLWTWNCYDSNSPWYGNGYHNFIIADVDEDGRDEIVYGSMVIDDNFQGLSTTGLGHGDAQHVSDLDPWRKGQEFFGCNEDKPGMNYRNATTSEIYIRRTAAKDDGRALMANLSNSYPGSIGRSVSTGMLSGASDKEIKALGGDSYIPWGDLNFRIYWDGDLCSEILNSPGTAKEAKIEKPGVGRLFTSDGCNMNNDSKNNPCFQGDLIGDWREEIVVRCGGNVRIYTSGMSTDYSITTLWHDHQYRQAMVWQMMAYNQPPHLSYFLGEMEGYTQAPPPLMTNGRTVIGSGTTINSQYNGQHLLHNEFDNTTLIMGGGTPDVLTINVPAWVQGCNNNDYITTTTYTCQLNGGAMSGNTRLIKQGNGILTMANNTHTNTGETNIWGGTVNFDGTMQNSPVWMNRHTTLNTTGGNFNAGLIMEYGATLNVGGTTTGNYSSVTVSDLTLNYGARVVLDVNGNGDTQHDWLNATTLTLDTDKASVANWKNFGPQFITPVFEVRANSQLTNGDYPIGHVGSCTGDPSKVAFECSNMNPDFFSLVYNNGVLYLHVDTSPLANEATFEFSGLVPYNNVATPYPSTSNNDYYLPVIKVNGSKSGSNNPTLSGTFTSAIDGSVTNISGNYGETEIYGQDYQQASNANDWVSQYATRNFYTDHTNYVQIHQGGGGGSRSAYKQFYTTGSSIYENDTYLIEFDAALHANNDNQGDNELILFGEGANMPASNAMFGSSDVIFKISGGKENGITYTVLGSNQSYQFTDGAWYHYAIRVNKSTKTISYTISQGNNTIGSGNYTISNNNVSLDIQGMFVGLNRYNSYCSIDNIVIKSSVNGFTYSFPEPGTLHIISSVTGYKPSEATYEVLYPYYKLYESSDYNTITAANAATTLGSDLWYWNADNPHVDARGWTRFSSWADITYTFAINRVNNNSQTMWVDKDNMLWVDFTNSSQALHLVEGYGVGQSGGSTFHAVGLGDENTIIYHRYANSANVIEEYTCAAADGSYSYKSGYDVLQKFIAYIPVSIHDELAKALPTELANGNAHLYRSGLKEASSWSTMVVPFDLKAEQAKELFGEDVVIGNLIESNAVSVRFETTSGVVYANQPFLIKNVTKDAPYLVMGITSTPVVTPRIIKADFDFIGRYTYPEGGTILFNTNDYFFNTSTGLLSTVKENNTAITMKGYRAYFHAPNSQAGAKDISILFDDEPINGIATSINTTDKLGLAGDKQPIYNLQGQRVSSNKNFSQLQRGVYIMNGRKIIVK